MHRRQGNKIAVQPGTGLEAVTVRENRELGRGAFLLTFKRIHEFLPGQVIRITLSQEVPPRLYSICSGVSDSEIRVLYNIKEGGVLTPRLETCRPGDTLYVSPPSGTFTDMGGPAWWIATGTGIAPFYSMVRSGLVHDKRLIHGVRYTSQFYFEDELKEAMGDRYVRCCSREKAGGTFGGRVTAFLEQETAIPPGIKYYLCGKALMVVEARDLLIARGVPYEHILSEIYF